MRSKYLSVLSCVAVTVIVPFAASGFAAELRFRAQELETRLTVGYAVRLIDLNGDGRRDIVIVDSKRFLWLENPSWKEHVMFEDTTARHDNVCFAPNDIDLDGKLDFAVGRDWQFGNTESGGTIGWLRQGESPAAPWTYHAIGEEPTTHRMRSFDVDGDGREEIIVAPLKGRQTTSPDFAENGVRILAYDVPADPVKGTWEPRVLDDQAHVTHNFWCTDLDRDGDLEVLLASFEGVTLLEREGEGKWRRTRIGMGDQKSSPNRGASEIRHGRLKGGGDYIATIEPWHGDKVVVYTRPAGARPASGEWLWRRRVLDDRLKWGHAVWCVDLDGDADEELAIGVRDDLDAEHRRGLRIYDPQDPDGASWKRTLVDAGGVAIEDLAAADLDRDGKADLVAVGRQTHNVKVYWNETE